MYSNTLYVEKVAVCFVIVKLLFSALDELKVPKCMSELKDKKANKGGKTFFYIKIRSDPPPTVTWLVLK
jgi:hypothetical protein